MSHSDDPRSNHADTAAMAALRDGDDTALNAIMDRWQEPITAFLYRTVGSYETALDLSQEVFVRIHRSRSSYKEGGNFSSFIFTIAANLAKNHFRWKGRHPEVPFDSGLSRGHNSREGSPSEYMEKTEESARIKKSIHSLPEILRVPVILYYFHEMPHSEIANILKCSEKTVETRLYRARKKLKSLLSDQKGEG